MRAGIDVGRGELSRWGDVSGVWISRRLNGSLEGGVGSRAVCESGEVRKLEQSCLGPSSIRRCWEGGVVTSLDNPEASGDLRMLSKSASAICNCPFLQFSLLCGTWALCWVLGTQS
jgi:hypothetical protein